MCHCGVTTDQQHVTHTDQLHLYFISSLIKLSYLYYSVHGMLLSRLLNLCGVRCMLIGSVAGAYSCMAGPCIEKSKRGRKKERRKSVMKKTDEGRNRKKEGDRHQPMHSLLACRMIHLKSITIAYTKISKRTDTNITKQEAVTCLHLDTCREFFRFK